jgi:alkylated DNA nucleotide flippase Atl1
VDTDRAERILDVVAAIPAGRVSTYGDVAARAGAPSPRLVGRVLADLSDDGTPWHRVLRADGRPAHHLAVEQLARLRAEGVLATGDRVDLRTYRWRG